MSEFWVSQGKHWCKYCKKWISSNKIQIRQHEGGDKHIAAEEEYVKSLSSKAVHSVSEARNSAIAVNAGDLLERISKAQQNAANSSADQKPEVEEDANAYPAPAEAVIGQWVEVKAPANEPDPEPAVPEEAVAPKLRVGATDEADEEEALAREAAAQAALVASASEADKDNATPVFKKRAISKSRKRQRRSRK